MQLQRRCARTSCFSQRPSGLRLPVGSTRDLALRLSELLSTCEPVEDRCFMEQDVRCVTPGGPGHLYQWSTAVGKQVHYLGASRFMARAVRSL